MIVSSERSIAVTLNLSSEMEARIRERAAILGQDVEDFVLQAVAEKLADTDSQPMTPSRDDTQWRKKLQALMDLHPVVTHFVDDSRESIYAGRGE
jgi:uncharacterized protein (DUF1778 family)